MSYKFDLDESSKARSKSRFAAAAKRRPVRRASPERGRVRGGGVPGRPGRRGARRRAAGRGRRRVGAAGGGAARAGGAARRRRRRHGPRLEHPRRAPRPGARPAARRQRRRPAGGGPIWGAAAQTQQPHRAGGATTRVLEPSLITGPIRL